jgi:hypothetical protein
MPERLQSKVRPCGHPAHLQAGLVFVVWGEAEHGPLGREGFKVLSCLGLAIEFSDV